MVLRTLSASVTDDTLSISVDARNDTDAFIEARFVWAVGPGESRSWRRRILESPAQTVLLRPHADDALTWVSPSSFAAASASLTVWAQVSAPDDFATVASQTVRVEVPDSAPDAIRYRAPTSMEIVGSSAWQGDGVLSVEVRNHAAAAGLVTVQLGGEPASDVCGNSWATRAISPTSVKDVEVPAASAAKVTFEASGLGETANLVPRLAVVMPSPSGSPELIDDALILNGLPALAGGRWERPGAGGRAGVGDCLLGKGSNGRNG